jgi:flavodoxin
VTSLEEEKRQEVSEMRALVIYDSQFGNTALIGDAIGRSLGGETTVRDAAHARHEALHDFDLVVVGSPTQGGRPTPAVQSFLHDILPGGLRGVSVAAFDTRFAEREHGTGVRILMHFIGFAAPRIASGLRLKSGELIAEPEGFIVLEKEGPLADGELERAAAWAHALAAKVVPREPAAV